MAKSKTSFLTSYRPAIFFGVVAGAIIINKWLALFVGFLLIGYSEYQRRNAITENAKESPEAPDQKKGKKKKAKQQPAKSAQHNTAASKGRQKRTAKAAAVQNPNLACMVKGHSHPINTVVVSSDAKRIVTSSRDAIRVFNAAGLLAKPQVYTYSRVPVAGDTCSAVNISSCGAYVICATASAPPTIHIWGVVSKKPKEVMSFPTDHSTKIDFAEFSTSGVKPFIVTASASRSDTTLRLWTKAGKNLTRVDTRKGQINAVSVSAEGRFIAVANWTSEVVIYEVCRNNNVFQKLAAVMSLKGHQSQVRSVCLCTD